MNQGKEDQIVRQIFIAVGKSLGLVHLLWVGFFLTAFAEALYFNVENWGMIPRTLEGLTGIVTMHFLHGNMTHLVMNSIGIFSILIPLCFFFDEDRHMPLAIFKICIIGGILLWLFGRPSIHIGSSLLYYGLAAYMVFGSIVHNQKGLLVYSLVSLALNSTTLISGLLPTDALVSWEGHLCGVIAGFLVAVGEKQKHDAQQCCELKVENKNDISNP